MNYSYFMIHLCLYAALLSSCELFGGGDAGPGGGEVVWKVENSTDRLVGTQPLIEEGTVYFVQDTQLKAYTLKEGKRLWSINTGNGNFSRAILSSENTLYLDEGFSIKAISKANGRVLWNNLVTPDATEFSGMGEPVMSQDEEHLYAGRRGYVLQLRKSDGVVTQHYPIDRLVPEGVSQGATEAIISPYGDGILYVSGTSFDRSQSTPEQASKGNIFAINSASGEYLWEREIIVTVSNPYTPASDDSMTGSPMIYDIEVTRQHVVVLAGFYIVALDRINGEVIWKTYLPESGFDVGLTVDAEAIYAASVGTYAHKLDLTTGEELWRRDIFYSNTSIPTVQNNRLYFANSGGGDIWVLDTSTGKVIYSKLPPGYKTDSHDIYISSLGVGEGYMVNVGSKAVYCLKVP